MTGGDDFLSRWSRRKKAVAEEEAPPRKEPLPEAVPARSEIAPPDGPTSDEPAHPLPRLEDVSADSDITAFLRKGVPEGLKRAALRRAWSLDPAIRDFVGPAEYAWDYNAPGSMAGFGAAGALETAEHVAQVVGLGAQPLKPESSAPELSTPPALEDRAPASGDEVGPADPSEPTPASPDTETVASSLPRPRHGGAVPR